jgi:soluble lytic murein transglycosylase-like protein
MPPLLQRCPRGLGLLLLATPGLLPGAWALDAQSCQALRAQGGKFALGMASCAPAAAPVAPGLLPRAAQAQQLHLFEPIVPASAEPPAPAAPAGAVPSRSRGGPAVRGGPRPSTAPAAPATAPATAPAASPMSSRPLPAALTRALQLAPAVERAAAEHAIDPLLLHAIARVESRHDPRAVSHAGARGLMQVMPATGARFGVAEPQALHHAPTNLDVSARYLRVLDRRFEGRLPLVLAAYNAGEGAVERHGRRIPPYAETQSYVRQVLTEYARLQAARGQAQP